MHLRGEAYPLSLMLVEWGHLRGPGPLALAPAGPARGARGACGLAVMSRPARLRLSSRIFLDAALFLAEALDSVLAESFQDFELLLVDDGWTDGSTTIARGFADRLRARGRYLEHPGDANRGMSASRNLGIRHARGPFRLLDADDVWLPTSSHSRSRSSRRRPT